MKKMLTFSSESAKNYYLINGHIMWAIGMILSFINETASPPAPPINWHASKEVKIDHTNSNLVNNLWPRISVEF